MTRIGALQACKAFASRVVSHAKALQHANWGVVLLDCAFFGLAVFLMWAAWTVGRAIP